jgi:hypothetical protein
MKTRTRAEQYEEHSPWLGVFQLALRTRVRRVVEIRNPSERSCVTNTTN